jgi:tryptophanyl-tRNA synthetase
LSWDCRAAAIGCIDCKKQVADRMVEQLAPVWDARAKLTKDPSQIEAIVQAGSRRASEVAKATLAEVNEAMKI